MDWVYLFAVFLAGVFLVGLYALWVLAWRLIPMFMGGAPWVPSDPANVETMMKLAQITPNDRTVDLGSGDGRIVYAAAEAGAKESVGYELDPSLVRYCAKKAARLGLKNTRFERKDFWVSTFSDFDVVFLFQIPFAMRRLKEKLKRELKPGSRIVSNSFTFPDWEPTKTIGTVRLYKI